ncbi:MULTISPECIES: hypothetical protein [Burkholderia]|uniref:hypothetical protein n=1 Tax=Burkholderia TaxID=32008 RepID=UPI000A74ABD6|nr:MULTISPECIES: hypothetical protein [Burkholderia]NBI45241.1 hypothetical protein [Burkholderia sp. ISTR5]
MPNCIQIQSENGYATLDQAVIHNNATTQFHFRTTKSSQQNIFSLVQYLGVLPTAQFWIFVGPDNTIGMSYHTKISKTIVTLKCSFPTNIFDGNWHQASVRMFTTVQHGPSYVVFYLDGVPIFVDGQPLQQELPTNFNFTGKIVLGYNQVVDALSHAPFVGDVAEIRIWGDSGSFLPRPRSPLTPDTPGLDNYWPFWTNYDKGMNLNVRQSASPEPAIFSNCSLGFVSALIYDPWNEAILNAKYQPFPAFTDGRQGSAAQDIMDQLVRLHALQPKSGSVAALRALYTNSEKIVPSTLPVALAQVTPSLSDPDYVTDFQFVRQQLLDEVETVQAVYQFEQDASNFITAYYVNSNSAFTALLSADLAPKTFTMQVDIGGGLAIAEALFEFMIAAPAEARADRNANSSDESISAGISLICSLIDFLVTDEKTQYESNAILSSSLEQINSTIVAEFNRRIGTVNSNGQAIIQDWGKLSAILENSDDFIFGYKFSQEMGNILFKNNLVFYSKYILTKQYAIWTIQHTDQNEIKYLGWPGVDVLNPNLSVFYPNTLFGGWNFYSVCNFDSNPHIITFTSAPSEAASNFLFNQCQLTRDDVLKWPFTQCIVNPY